MQAIGKWDSPVFYVINTVGSCVTKTINFFEKVHKEWQGTKKNWYERAITQLNSWENSLDQRIPNLPIQEKIDRLGKALEEKFAPLTEFTNWLNSNGHGPWFQQLATFLVKLPLRIIRNIVKVLYDIVKTCIYATTHPLKALNQLAKLLVTLVHELTNPETWTKLGCGMIGASVGHSLVTGNPFSVIGLGIGAALVIAGLSVGALQAALEAEEGEKGEAAMQNLFSQTKEMPETLLTGLCMGLIFGGIQRITEAPVASPAGNDPAPPVEVHVYREAPQMPVRGHPDISGFREYYYPKPWH